MLYTVKKAYRSSQTHPYVSGDANAAGVVDGEYVSVTVDNERGTTFDKVKIRVDDSFTLEMHIDTDEANASEIKQGDKVTIVKK